MGNLRFIAALGVLLLCVPINYELLREAYGDGPPYYGRTTNMDKWESPAPILVPIDLAALALATWMIIRKPKEREKNRT